MTFFNNLRRTADNADNDEEAIEVSAMPLQPESHIEPPKSIGFETVIGANCVLEGQLESEGNIRLDGIFTGTLDITGNVLVGETAKIKANLGAKNISIAGEVRGNVSGRKVQLLRTARVWGDITATTLTTEEGAFIEGKISMMSSPTDEVSDNT